MHPNHNNYGTSLQGFATVASIQKLNYPFRIIRYKKRRSIVDLFSTLPGLIRSGAVKEMRSRLYQKAFNVFNPSYVELIADRTTAVNKFKAKFFDCISDYYVGYDSLCEGSKNYDVVFIGSDQVWGPLSLYSKFYNLLFVNKNIPQFSYASSFGVSSIFKWQQKETKKYLDKMDIIGVREVRGKEIVEELSKHNAKVVVDPTMLLSKEDWEKYTLNSKSNINEPYILTYILGPRRDIREEIIALGKKTGLKIVSFRHMDWYEPADDNFGDIPIYNADPLDFINLLSKAKYVCTDSFHGTVFSIIFNKNFLTFYRQLPTSSKSTHSRIDSLLGLFNLNDRLFHNDAMSEVSKEINYNQVNSILKTLREDSRDFLIKALEITK